MRSEQPTLLFIAMHEEEVEEEVEEEEEEKEN